MASTEHKDIMEIAHFSIIIVLALAFRPRHSPNKSEGHDIRDLRNLTMSMLLGSIDMIAASLTIFEMSSTVALPYETLHTMHAVFSS